MSDLPVVRLKADRDRSARHRHPWVFSGAVDSVAGSPGPGAVVDVVTARGDFLGRGYYNEQSRIRVRMLAWEPLAIDADFWRDRITAAASRRAGLLADGRTTACRLVHAEADLLPGLFADRYADVVVVQLLTAGVERVRDEIADAFSELPGVSGVFERSDAASRAREGLVAAVGTLRKTAPGTVAMRENGHQFSVNVETGQKTGFYLDQRDNRAAVASLAAGCTVLDAFSHTGAFAVYAAGAGARSVTLVDSSAPSLQAARAHLDANAPPQCTRELHQADVFETLRAFRDAGRRFDLIVLDPPKFALSAHQVDKALRAYKDINLVAMELLVPGGTLATFSCSQAVDAASFTMAVSWAGVDARRDVQVVRRLGQGADHPVLASFPESEYLKGLLCRVL